MIFAREFFALKAEVNHFLTCAFLNPALLKQFAGLETTAHAFAFRQQIEYFFESRIVFKAGIV